MLLLVHKRLGRLTFGGHSISWKPCDMGGFGDASFLLALVASMGKLMRANCQCKNIIPSVRLILIQQVKRRQSCSVTNTVKRLNSTLSSLAPSTILDQDSPRSL